MESDNPQSLHIRIRLRLSLKEAVRELAKQENRSFANMAGVLLQEALTARSSA